MVRLFGRPLKSDTRVPPFLDPRFCQILPSGSFHDPCLKTHGQQRYRIVASPPPVEENVDRLWAPPQFPVPDGNILSKGSVLVWPHALLSGDVTGCSRSIFPFPAGEIHDFSGPWRSSFPVALSLCFLFPLDLDQYCFVPPVSVPSTKVPTRKFRFHFDRPLALRFLGRSFSVRGFGRGSRKYSLFRRVSIALDYP